MERKRPSRGNARVTRIETIMVELELYSANTEDNALSRYVRDVRLARVVLLQSPEKNGSLDIVREYARAYAELTRAVGEIALRELATDATSSVSVRLLSLLSLLLDDVKLSLYTEPLA